MKNSYLIKNVLFFILLILVIIKAQGQTGLNFQGVARISSNVILTSQAISIKLSILQGSATGIVEYTETRKVFTNAQGLFTAIIGDTGAISKLGNFSSINWKLSPKFLKIEMDPSAGTNFITMGTTQFQYVAYAQFAKSVDAENIMGIIPIHLGGTGVNSLSGLKTALTLNNVNNTSDADKIISTKTQTALDLILLTATDTSRYATRINSKANITDLSSGLALKLNKSDTISLSNRIDLKINSDAVNFTKDINVNGIVIGIGAGKIISNTRIGQESLINNTTGGNNTATGMYSLNNNTTGFDNTANGNYALTNNTTGSYNTAMGLNALKSNKIGNHNTALGNSAGAASVALENTTAIGDSAIVSESNAIQLGNAFITNVKTSGTITAGSITYPNYHGTPNQVLKTIGSGSLTWTDLIADADILTGTTLNKTVTSSSLTSVGTLSNVTVSGKAVVGSTSPVSASAILEASSTTQGFLPPRMTKAQRDVISSPVSGLMIWCTDNFGGEIEVYNGSIWVNMNGFSNSTLSVGNIYQGGKIGYILVSGDPGWDSNTQHGLIASISDQSTSIRWFNGANTTTGATQTEIANGLANTNKIIASQGGTPITSAAGLARAYTGGGYTDWYLPSKDELNKLQFNRVAIGGFSDNYYWSSTENDSYNSWNQNFGNGDQNLNGKSYSNYVRAIRAF